ncbi:MAG: hypothetical protein JWR24_4121 [Actinoallomurus sp.]|nr:hypothetical protein [Actinoallomurus sp.]
MDIDLTQASAFMTTHARIVDRRRFDLITGRGRADDVLSALVAYRNDDGGFGWGLEPDLRSPESQPVGALHAFEVFEEVGPDAGEPAAQLCDWLASITLPDGGLPFAVPVTDSTGSAPWWLQADPSQSSLHLTAAIADIAHRAARHDPTVRHHEWLGRATDYCWQQIVELDGPLNTLQLRYVLWFLDAIHDVRPGAPAELERLGKLIPDNATLAVEGGIEGEALHPLDFSPRPDQPLRGLLVPDTINPDLNRLAAQQQDDGGWIVDFASQSVAGALEWRGYATVRAVKTLLAHQGR